ncbi:hypothetical protein WDW86_10250 [Bdellovibrionota bacterium FG-2]
MIPPSPQHRMAITEDWLAQLTRVRRLQPKKKRKAHRSMNGALTQPFLDNDEGGMEGAQKKQVQGRELINLSFDEEELTVTRSGGTPRSLGVPQYKAMVFIYAECTGGNQCVKKRAALNKAELPNSRWTDLWKRHRTAQREFLEDFGKFFVCIKTKLSS